MRPTRGSQGDLDRTARFYDVAAASYDAVKVVLTP